MRVTDVLTNISRSRFSSCEAMILLRAGEGGVTTTKVAADSGRARSFIQKTSFNLRKQGFLTKMRGVPFEPLALTLEGSKMVKSWITDKAA